MSWKYTINIKPFLSNREEKEDIELAIDGIVREISKLPKKIKSTIPKEVYKYFDLALTEEDVSIFNLGLDYFYNWADDNEIWVSGDE